MNRPHSPILHDYKPSGETKHRKHSALPWFAAGLGLPLIGIAVVLSQPGNPVDPGTSQHGIADADVLSVSAAVATPDQSATSASQADIEIHETDSGPLAPAAPFVQSAATDPVVAITANFHPPLQLPPEFDRLELTIKRGDTLDQLFRKNDLKLGDLAAIIRLTEAAPYLRKLIPGDNMIIEHDNGSLVSLYREITLTSALKISRADERFVTEIIDRPLEKRRKLAYGRIETSLFESAAEAGLQDKLIMNLAGIFAWDVDFVLDIRSGDDYYILYEELFQDGEFITSGEIVAAEFNNNGRTIQAIRFIDDNGRSDYFTPDGRSVRKAFVRAPVDFTRISSNFNPNRKHPILNTIRAHRGVDYAAPRGTPIKAAGDGKVIFRGIKSGYGNTVILQHGGNITTLYAHMSSFDRNSGLGRRVSQGQTIGYVGKTGLATANHLHYEYRLNGVHRNPRTVSLPQADPIRDEYRDAFLASVAPILDELLQYKRTQVAALAAE